MSTYAVQHAEDDFRAGRELGLDHLKLGMWIFLASEVMFFGGLIATFAKNKFANPSPEAQALDIVLVGLNTFLLLTSSFTVVLGLSAIHRGDRSGLIRNMFFTVLLGGAFLAGQITEFRALFHEGINLQSSLFGSSFFTVTSFHGMHVFVGLLWALGVIVFALRGRYSPESHDGVEIFGLYWHFVDIVWIVLFTVIYLL